ncbi:MAG: Pr6Pr family membrane protein [Bifidobacteriaceae bacterium]|nr:Pr6Pr family membrane protein [Bifidobacteriaceae bacterium]
MNHTNRTSRTIRLALNAFIVIAAGFGIVVEAAVLGAGTALTAFTIQSNALAMVMAAVTLARDLRGTDPGGPGYQAFAGMALTSVLLTFAVFNIALRGPMGGGHPVSLAGVASELLHVVVPLGVLADWVVFGRRGSVRPWHPLVWALFPLYYLAFTAAYRALGGVYQFGPGEPQHFPYFFLDYETYGLGQVALWMGFIVVGFLGTGYVLYAVDKGLAALSRSPFGAPALVTHEDRRDR